MGREAPRVDVLELGADVQGRVVQRLPGNIMWDRANPAARAVAKSAVEARPPEVARDETLTETVCATAADAIVGEPVGEARPPGIAQSRVEGSNGEAGSSCLGAEKTPSAGITAVAVLAGGVRSTGIAKQSAATKSELAECKLAAPRQSPHSKSPLVKLDPLGPEPVARTVPQQQQSQTLLMKVDLQGL